MKTIWQLSAAAGAGYLLRGWTTKLAGSPEIVKLGETIRGDLMNSARAAAVAAASSRIESLNSRLLASEENMAGNGGEVAGTPRGSREIRDSHVDEPPESEEERSEDSESAAGEHVGEDEGLSEVEEGEQDEGRGETEDSAATESPEQEKVSKRRPRKRARDTSTAKEIRQWAVQEGYEISPRGRIPTNIEHAFDAVH